MRITTRVSWDWDGNLLGWEGYEYDGPVASAKGGTGMASQNFNTANAMNQGLYGQAESLQGQLLPFLQQEMLNPQGMGPQGVNQLVTSGGQAVSGELGQAREAASLRASRMGNPSSTAAIEDAATRAGLRQQSNNILGINEEDLKLKLAQQQAGAQGLGALGAQDLNAALSSLGLSNQAVSDYTAAWKASNPMQMIDQATQAVGNLGGAAANFAKAAGG